MPPSSSRWLRPKLPVWRVKFLEAIKNIAPDHEFFQAFTSEMYGDNLYTKQIEGTVFEHFSPYAAAKLYAHRMVKICRKGYGIFACNGIIFNHESPLPGLTPFIHMNLEIANPGKLILRLF